VSIITRFAPSPTGELHLGHAFAAKVAHDFARNANGLFFLRQEDIDSSRVKADFYDQIEVDLKWLGLFWDGEILHQSSRQQAYDAALDSIKSMELVYPCFCTRKDIQAALSAPHGSDAVIYPGTCRHISKQEATDRITTGEAHCWRFHSEKAALVHGALNFQDLRFGKILVDPKINGDAILARKEIGVAYHLAVVADDAFQKITHVTRGEDLLGATHIHRQLQAILGFAEPTYLHHACICDENGKRLAKRDQARSIRAFRDAGLSPPEVLAMLSPS
jgi:glutamyl-Q tRNA(Asp) synthetase